MHSIKGTFIDIKDKVRWNLKEMDLYPVKIIIPPNKSRVLYFESLEYQTKWSNELTRIVGYKNLQDFYTLGNNLGKG